MAAFVKFWGTRGSIPTPSSWTRVYGGNTSCVEIRFDDTVFICDAGSGIRELGKDLLARRPAPAEFHLLLTHTHWDHIQGFPFFVPVYIPTSRIRVYGNSAEDNSRYRLLSGQMASDYFPVSFADLGAQILFDHLNGGEREINGVRVRSFPLNHPGGCNGFVFEKEGVKIVYATDNELTIQPGDTFPDAAHVGDLRQIPSALVEIARDADLLITDSQYDDDQYATKRGWGHSSCFSVTDWAVRSGVKNLALFHHDPESTDRDVEAKVKSCALRAAKHGGKFVLFAAREGVELKFQPRKN
ncbi:MAG: MBL fold metallo-hydrolase [Verrucomicrobiota bacterium]